MPDRLMRVIIATPYSEGSINSIARSLHSGQLQRVYVTLHGRRYLPILDWFRRDPVGLRHQLNRRWGDFPLETVNQVAPVSEVIRALLPTNRTVRQTAMYRGKRIFDERVSRHIEREHCDVVVGMQGSCSRTLSQAKDMGRLTVLNHVNSHAETHNRALRQLGGAPHRHHELIPDDVVADEARELAAADVILAPSGYVARQLLNAGIPPQRIHIQPYGVDTTRFNPGSNSRGPEERVHCLFVGAISIRKGIPGLVAAARQLRSQPVEFQLVGPLFTRPTLAGAPANVNYLGRVSSAEVARAMQCADIFVFPTLDDSFGLAVLEAMASGLPVIVSEHAGSSEMITHGVDGMLIPPGDSGALCEAVVRLTEDPELRTTMGLAASRTARGAWTWHRHGTAVRQTLERMTNAAGSTIPM